MKNRLHILLTLLLIAIDELVKIYIVYVKRAELNVCNAAGELIHFHPTYNEAGSALALKTGLEFSPIVFMLTAIVGSGAIVYIRMWYEKQLIVYQRNNMGLLLGFDIMLAGTLGRIVERVFWRYTLDYIAIRGISICDLLDIYLFLGLVGILPIIIYVDVKRTQSKKLKSGC